MQRDSIYFHNPLKLPAAPQQEYWGILHVSSFTPLFAKNEVKIVFEYSKSFHAAPDTLLAKPKAVLCKRYILSSCALFL